MKYLKVRSIRFWSMIAVTAVMATSMLTMSCSKVNFAQDPNAVVKPKCADIIQTTQEKLRILFMVDNSDSTTLTDPDQNVRIKTIQEFIKKYGAKQNFTYAFGMFCGESGGGFLYDSGTHAFGSNANAPFLNSAGLSQALMTFDTLNTCGRTPYMSAFNILQNAIVNDTSTSTEKWKYIIVFMSDGMPTDLGSDNSTIDTNLTNLLTNLKQSVVNHGSAVSISAVYFGPESTSNDTAAVAHVQLIANLGKGQFVDTNVNGDLSIDDVLTIPGGQTCQ